MLTARVKNLPADNYHLKYECVVVTKDGSNLWFYGAYDKKRADEVAQEVDGIVLFVRE